MEHKSRMQPQLRGSNPAVGVAIAIIVALGAIGLFTLFYLVGWP
jgi:hypothetical protein